MRATHIFGAGDVRVVDAPDPAIEAPGDAIVRVSAACVCGSDLHPYRGAPANPEGASIGHEFVGVVEEVGADVATVRPGDFVIAPFAWSCGACDFCREGLQTSCRVGGYWNTNGSGGGQAQAVRVPLADGTLVKAPATDDPGLLASLLTLSDVYGTGWHAAVTGGVRPGSDVVVIGDGAVGLLAVLSAKRLGAERIVLMGRHEARTRLGVEFGATDVVAARGEEGVAAVRDLLPGRALFGPNVTLTGGVAPVRAYIERLLPGVLAGEVSPGRVFDATLGLEDCPKAYRLMDAREALKVMVLP